MGRKDLSGDNLWLGGAAGVKPSNDDHADLNVLMQSVEDDDTNEEGDNTEGAIESGLGKGLDSLLSSVQTILDEMIYVYCFAL